MGSGFVVSAPKPRSPAPTPRSPAPNPAGSGLGFAVLGLAIWWDGYVARQVRRRRAAGADADADTDVGVKGTQEPGVEKVGKKKSARAAQAQKQPKAQSKKTK